METRKYTFDITPSANIMDVLGSSGYTLETAIADIMDNSISAKATEISIDFNINNCEDDAIVIKDNGTGMTLEAMQNAAVLAYTSQDEERDISDLGRYSLGLKSASRSFCNKIYLISKKEDDVVNSICIDFAEIKATGKFLAYGVDYPEYEQLINEHGTLVVCKDLKIIDKDYFDRARINERIAQVEQHVSHTYSDFILNKSLTIKIGKYEVEAWDPFMLYLDNVKTLDIDPIIYKNEKIIVTPYILPAYQSLSEDLQKKMIGKGLSEQQGFYVYRNGRIISEGGWLNLPGLTIDNKSNMARIRVDITSALDDEFNVNFMKSTLEVPDKLKKEFIRIAKLARKESLNSYNYMKKPSLKRRRKVKETIPVWNVSVTDKSISLSINEEHPIIKDITKTLSAKDVKKLFSLLAKEFPVARVQNSEVNEKEYSDDEIKSLIEETYYSLIAEGLNDEEVQKKMASMEPFCQEKYYMLLAEFLISIGGEQ